MSIAQEWTALLLKERCFVSNEALVVLKNIILATQQKGKSLTTKAENVESMRMELCCESLYAVILPGVCSSCAKNRLQGSSPSKSHSLPNYSSDEKKLHSTLFEKLEGILFHGLKFGNNPLFGYTQQLHTAAGFVELLRQIVKQSNTTTTRVDPDVFTLRGTLGRFDAFVTRKKKVNKKNDPVLLAKLLLRFLLSTKNCLSSLANILFSYNGSKIVQKNYAPWALLRSKCNDEALKNAIVVLKRADGLFQVDLEEEDLAELGRVGSQVRIFFIWIIFSPFKVYVMLMLMLMLTPYRWCSLTLVVAGALRGLENEGKIRRATQSRAKAKATSAA